MKQADSNKNKIDSLKFIWLVVRVNIDALQKVIVLDLCFRSGL